MLLRTSNIMTPNTLPSSAVDCAENIALLYLLHSVPAPPSHNPTDHLPVHQKGYTLSLMQERSLVGTLAFLSNLKDGPDDIPAVCVEESPDSAFLNILLAVNRTKAGDGKEVLKNLKFGFEKIFALLSKVSDDGTAVGKDQIFTAIISMCSARILCRLRFISNSRKTSRQPIKELLQEAINSVQQLESKTDQDSKLLPTSTSFVEGVKAVVKLVDAWVKHRTQTRLGELVEGVYRLWRVKELRALVNTIPNRSMSPASRKNLLNIISKVTRYREAARFLYCKAKELPLVRQMKIVLVNLPQDMFHREPANQYTPTLPATLSRISALHGQQWNVGHTYRLLSLSEIEANNMFAQRTRKTLKDAKIHAEIQLVLYCELKAFKLPPRVVCSTKDACFLCNAFIRMHGKIHTPRCHGRLYPGWRIPRSPRFMKIEQNFNRELESHIRNSLATLFLRQQKTVYPDPNESTLLTLPVSVSTLRSLALTEAVIEDEKRVLQPQRPNSSETEKTPLISSTPKALHEFPESRSSSRPAARTGDVVIQASNDIAVQLIPSTISWSQGLSSDNIFISNNVLLQGQILSKSVKGNHASPLYAAGPFEVQIEYLTRPSRIMPNRHPSNLPYSIEWLTVDEAEKVQKHHAASTFNAESLEDGISRNIGDLNCFYLTARGSTLKIVLQPGITVI